MTVEPQTPIEARRLEKSFGQLPVLRGLDLRVPNGSIYGLLGRNGAGKTTLLRTLMGLALPNGGTARVLGQELGVGNPAEKAWVGYVAQGEALPPWARISDLVWYESKLRPTWDPSSLESWLRVSRISSRCKVAKLSVGQRKRLELELMLSSQPSVLLLDEPLAGLDPLSRAEIIETLIAHVADTEATVLLSSHVISDLERLCDRIGILARGVIAFEDSMDDLKERGDDLRTLSVGMMRELEAEAAE